MQFDSTLAYRFFDSFPQLAGVKKELLGFYRMRNFSYAWYDKNGLIEPAENLYNRIVNISEEGITGHFSYSREFTDLMDEGRESNRSLPVLELMLTAQYFQYAHIAWQGVNEKEYQSLNWLLPRKKVPMISLLDSLVSGKASFEKAPVYRQYDLLKEMLKKYREIGSQENWTALKAPKKAYVLGDSSADIAVIRRRLFLTGDLPLNSNSPVYDQVLSDGIRSFQHRTGLKEDGKATTAFFREFNKTPDERIRQIMVNMERCRWIPENPTGNYLVVNIPDFKLYCYDDDSLIWNMNVVVGQQQHKTVVFNGVIKYIVFSPYWNVPRSILNKEILPALRRNKNYLAKHDMEWYNNGQVRQRPGPNNSLGLVKFLFPNSHSIYLHDTPAKSLFNESSRAFSHGCIRLADARKLAIYLLRNEPGWTENRIDSAMHAGVERTFTLKNPMPVYIAYFTAWVGRDHKVHFRNDLYKRDERLLELLLK